MVNGEAGMEKRVEDGRRMGGGWEERTIKVQTYDQGPSTNDQLIPKSQILGGVV